jgi:F-box-like
VVNKPLKIKTASHLERTNDHAPDREVCSLHRNILILICARDSAKSKNAAARAPRLLVEAPGLPKNWTPEEVTQREEILIMIEEDHQLISAAETALVRARQRAAKATEEFEKIRRRYEEAQATQALAAHNVSFLEGHIQELRDGIEAKRGMLHPIRRIPDTILELILHLSLDFAEEITTNSTELMNATAVCRHWRLIALSSPSLWRNIPIRPRRPGSISLFKEFVLRSGKRDVTIVLFDLEIDEQPDSGHDFRSLGSILENNGLPVDSVVQMVIRPTTSAHLPNLSSWAVTLPNVTHLDITAKPLRPHGTAPSFFLSHFPALQTLGFWATWMWPIFSNEVKLVDSLSFLDMQSLRPDTLKGILDQAINVTDLDLSIDLHFGGEPETTSLGSFQHNSLTWLGLDAVDILYTAYAFCGDISFPNLDWLCICFETKRGMPNSGFPTETFHTRLEALMTAMGNCPKLVNFQVCLRDGGIFPTGGEAKRQLIALRFLPRIQYLMVRPFRPSETGFAFLAVLKEVLTATSLSSTVIWPQLAKLDVENTRSFPVEMVLSTVKARREPVRPPSMQIAKIREVNFFNCDPLTVEEKKELDGLLVLPDARTSCVLNYLYVPQVLTHEQLLRVNLASSVGRVDTQPSEPDFLELNIACFVSLADSAMFSI